MGVFITIAIRNLLQSKRRTAFLGLALSLVTMLLILLLGLSQGISDNLIGSATTLSAGHINVGGFYKITNSDVSPILTGSGQLMKDVAASTPGVERIIDRHRGWAKLVTETSSMYAGLNGVDIKQEDRLVEVVHLAQEKEYREGGSAEVKGDVGRLSEPNTAMIFVAHAKRLGVGVGDVITLRTETLDGYNNTVDVTVVAVAQDFGLLSNWTIFVPKQTLVQLYQLKPDTTGAIMIYLDNIEDAEPTMATLRANLLERGYRVMDHQGSPFFAKFETVQGEDWTGQKLDLTTWEDEVSFLTWILTAFDMITVFLVGVLVVIIAIGIMNTMWMAVRERTAEIGTLRAIGMSRGRVLFMFVAEAFVLGLVATSAGAVLGLVIALVLNALAIDIPVDAVRAILLSDTLVLSVTARHMVESVAALTFFTVAAALWPSIRASRLQPVTAMQHVE